jgi:hypothetical protein
MAGIEPIGTPAVRPLVVVGADAVERLVLVDLWADIRMPIAAPLSRLVVNARGEVDQLVGALGVQHQDLGVRGDDGRGVHTVTREPPDSEQLGAVTTTLLGYDRAGSGGPPLLLLHGFGTTRADFAGLLPGFARDFDVVAMDLPGHSSSPMVGSAPTVAALTDAVAATLDALGLGRVHVLGNSLGGRVAIELARRQRTLSVVSVRCDAHPAFLRRHPQAASHRPHRSP